MVLPTPQREATLKHPTAAAAGGLLVNALVYGLSWWPFRTLQAYGLHPLWATALMYGAVLLLLTLVQPKAWRGLLQYPALWWLVLASGMTNLGFNWAVTLGDVVRVVLLFYLMPAWSVLVAWWLLDEKPTVMAMARLALALTGVALVLKTPDSPWPIPQNPADWLALMGGLSFALTNVLLHRMRTTPDDSRVVAMFGGGAVTTAVVAVWGGWQGLVPDIPPLAMPWLVVAGVTSVALIAANQGLQYGAARLNAHTTALIMLSEVVIASVSSIAMGAAQFSLRELAGGCLIMLAAGLAAWT